MSDAYQGQITTTANGFTIRGQHILVGNQLLMMDVELSGDNLTIGISRDSWRPSELTVNGNEITAPLARYLLSEEQLRAVEGHERQWDDYNTTIDSDFRDSIEPQPMDLPGRKGVTVFRDTATYSDPELARDLLNTASQLIDHTEEGPAINENIFSKLNLLRSNISSQLLGEEGFELPPARLATEERVREQYDRPIEMTERGGHGRIHCLTERWLSLIYIMIKGTLDCVLITSLTIRKTSVLVL